MEVNIEKQIETLSCHFFPDSLVYNPLIFHKKEKKKTIIIEQSCPWILSKYLVLAKLAPE
jgi:hypothetical protein